MARRPHQSGLTIDAVRARQLRLMAEREGVTVSEWLDQIIVREWSDTGCFGLPGFKVIRAIGPDNETPVVMVSIDRPDNQAVRLQLAMQDADTLSIAMGQGCAGDARTITGDDITYRRKGNGFVLSLITSIETIKHPFHPSVARDLARQIADTITPKKV
ncbi:hypothetical protein [Paramagnetospirillum magnetotacticum]|uniref:hypothetical protein n=1 Tax=Paramagnetospirillum magnetotacticum TaxID=188 RepID=UPI001269B787|nr:hypothetical protein [Paramagnetospirillum magnetotacticum]